MIHLARTKTDQGGAGADVGVPFGSNPDTCPVRAFRAWLKSSRIKDGPAFREVDRHGKLGEAPLDGRAVARILYGEHKWAGLEWRHIGEDLVLLYTPSKTRASSGAEVVIDLRLCPMVLEEMARVPDEARSGPLIVNEATALPFTDQQFLSAWKRVRVAAGLPVELWSRDQRASAITEGRGGGALTDDVAKVAGHTKPRTTADVYDRERLEAHRRFATARLGRRAPKSEA